MVVYPIIAGQLELDPTSTSIFLGGTIHDVAQVVGAGYSVSEQTGDLATLTKLVRVAYLMPVVLCILLVIKLNVKKSNGSDLVNAKSPGVPGFLIAFAVLMTINSLVELPELVTSSASELSRFALVVSITAIGMKSNLRRLLTVGIKPILLLVIETLWIAGLILLSLPYLA